jgi:hypothetical protein
VSVSIAGCIYLLLLAWYISKNLHGKNHATIGDTPKTIFTDNFFQYVKFKEFVELEDYNEKSLRLKMFIWNTIEHYQEGIEFNKNESEKRWRRINRCIKWLIATPFVLLTFLLIIKFY